MKPEHIDLLILALYLVIAGIGAWYFRVIYEDWRDAKRFRESIMPSDWINPEQRKWK